MTDEGVKLVREQIAKPKGERCTGILQGFWNTFRKKTSGTSVKQEEPDDSEMVLTSENFTGERTYIV